MSEYNNLEHGGEYPQNVNTNILIRDHQEGREIYDLLKKLDQSLVGTDGEQADLVIRASLFALQELKQNQTPEYITALVELETKLVNLRNARLRNKQEEVAGIKTEFQEKLIVPYEFNEKLVQGRLDELIETYAKRVNEGGNAYIFQVDFGLVPVELIHELGLPESKGENAIKILKFFRPGTMKKEIKKQELFYKVLKDGNGDLPVSEVPKPLGYYTLRVAEKTEGFNVSSSQPLTVEVSAEHIEVLVQKKLPLSWEKGQDANGQETQRRLIEVELAIMDYIDGKDIATLMMEWILQHPPENKDPMAIPDSFNELRIAVSNMLDLRPHEDDAESEPRVLKYMQDEIYNHLKATGFKINSAVIEQLINTKKVLDEHKLRHPDAHSRNVMISGDVYGQDSVKTHLIDFGDVQDADTKDLDAIIVLLKRLNSD